MKLPTKVQRYDLADALLRLHDAGIIDDQTLIDGFYCVIWTLTQEKHAEIDMRTDYEIWKQTEGGE